MYYVTTRDTIEIMENSILEATKAELKNRARNMGMRFREEDILCIEIKKDTFLVTFQKLNPRKALDENGIETDRTVYDYPIVIEYLENIHSRLSYNRDEFVVSIPVPRVAFLIPALVLIAEIQ